MFQQEISPFLFHKVGTGNHYIRKLHPSTKGAPTDSADQIRTIIDWCRVWSTANRKMGFAQFLFSGTWFFQSAAHVLPAVSITPVVILVLLAAPALISAAVLVLIIFSILFHIDPPVSFHVVGSATIKKDVYPRGGRQITIDLDIDTRRSREPGRRRKPGGRNRNAGKGDNGCHQHRGEKRLFIHMRSLWGSALATYVVCP
jgi:hypothetical protein